MRNLLLATLVLVIFIYLLFKAFFGGIELNKYQDLQIAKEHHAISSGFVPSILPKSAYNIEETHDDSSGNIYGAFDYKEQDEKGLISKLTPLEGDNKTMKWGNFLFKVDSVKNHVLYRSKKDQK